MSDEMTEAMRPVVEGYLADLFRADKSFGGYAPGEGVNLFLDDFVAHIVVKKVEVD